MAVELINETTYTQAGLLSVLRERQHKWMVISLVGEYMTEEHLVRIINNDEWTFDVVFMTINNDGSVEKFSTTLHESEFIIREIDPVAYIGFKNYYTKDFEELFSN